jgi:hypothetical protein
MSVDIYRLIEIFINVFRRINYEQISELRNNINICIYMYTYVYKDVYIYVNIYKHVYICIYLYIYMFMYINI